MRSTASGSATSVAWTRAVPPSVRINSTVVPAPTSSMSAMVTAAPSAARRRAVARPIPEPAPVTIAILSWKRCMLKVSRGPDCCVASMPMCRPNRVAAARSCFTGHAGGRSRDGGHRRVTLEGYREALQAGLDTSAERDEPGLPTSRLSRRSTRSVPGPKPRDPNGCRSRP